MEYAVGALVGALIFYVGFRIGRKPEKKETLVEKLDGQWSAMMNYNGDYHE